MNIFEKVKKYYDMGFYKNVHIQKIVQAGKLTADEYKLITGEDY